MTSQSSIRHLASEPGPAAAPYLPVDCASDPIGSLVEMFVGMVQSSRIAKGQCPAFRPVFLKPHGVARGTLRINPDLPDDLRGAEKNDFLRAQSLHDDAGVKDAPGRDQDQGEYAAEDHAPFRDGPFGSFQVGEESLDQKRDADRHA